MHAMYVGRVGALAVALGIGTAILGFSTVASADSGSSTGAGSATGASGGEPSQAARPRGGARRGAPDTSPATTTEAGPVRAARRSAELRSAAGVPAVPGRTSGLSPASVPQSPADLIGALLTPGGMTGLAQEAMSSLLETIFSAVPADVLTTEGMSGPDIASELQAATVTTPEAPVMAAQPDALSVSPASSLDALGGGSGGGDSLAAPLAWAAMAVTQKEGQADATVAAPAATVTSGEPVDPAAATTYIPFPDLPVKTPACPSYGVCGELYTYRPTIVNNISQAFASSFNLPEPEACVSGKGCPDSVANTVGMYGFNVIYALMGDLKDNLVAHTVQQLASQPQILAFVAQRTAGNFPNLPPGIQNLIGAAAATFVLKSFGSTSPPPGKSTPPDYVALAFVPFLKAFNLPTSGVAATDFLLILKKGNPNAEILKKYDPGQAQKQLVAFFGTSSVQQALGNAFADSIRVMLVPTLADYIGTQSATAILGEGNTNIPTLGSTIGNAVSELFKSTGDTIATQAGNAFVAFLSAPMPGQDVPTILANNIDNDIVKILRGPNPDPKAKPIPYPDQPPLIPSLAPAAGYAATTFVSGLLNAPGVPAALGEFTNQLIPGMLANTGVQQVLGADAAKAVTNFLGADAFAQAVGNQVGIAVSNLAAIQEVQTALVTFVDSLGAKILSSDDATKGIATAAGLWVEADLAGTLDDKKKQTIIAGLRTNAAIDDAVNKSVQAGVQALFDKNNPNVLTDLNSAAVSLATALLSNTDVQTALGARVSSEVAKLFKNQALGQAVGVQAGAAVVGFLGNPDTRSAIVDLVDTMASDFFGTQGVPEAFATLAGAVAEADFSGSKDTAAAIATFKANAAVQAGVQKAVGAAVRDLLTRPGFLNALDTAASSFVSGLLSSADLRAGISTAVAADVSAFLGGGTFGQAVGAQVGSAVAGLLSQQAVQTALVGLVDTELGDFFKAPGVVDAFVTAADTFALDTLAGEGGASKAAVATLRASKAVQLAVGNIVAAAVADLLNDNNLWSAGDAAAERLVAGLLASSDVQQGVTDRIEKAFGTTEFQQAVGVQVAAAVVNLMKNPKVSVGLVGVVDTVLTDFFGTQGVVSAFSIAAGELAAATVAGDEKTAQQDILNGLRNNAAVKQGVNKAVGDAVTSLLNGPDFVGALNDALAKLGSDLLGDPAVQAGLENGIAKEVSRVLGGGALGDAVGDQVGIAVVEILSNPVVKDALEGLVDTELGDFFHADGVVAAFSAAADTFALDLVGGKNVRAAANDAVTQLRTTPAVDTAVQNIVTATVSELLKNQSVWQAVDGTTSRLMANLLANTEVQNAVADKVYVAVWNAFNQTFLGVAVGDQAAAAVVSLMQNPAFSVALVGLVDTTSVDFFGYPGVAQAFSDAAGELASAAVQGPEQFKAASAQVKVELRANPAVEQAAGKAVGDAVETLLTDPGALAALDHTAAALMNELLTDPTVGAILSAQIADDVSKFLGGGALGESVGNQIGTAVVGFLADPNVRAAFIGLVDNELGDFFQSPGVAAAFAQAATTFTVEVVTGDDVKASLNAAVQSLRANADVENAITGIVTDSVANVLSNVYVIRTLDDDLGTLLTNLEPYAGQIISVLVTRSLGSSPIAAPVGQAIGAAAQQLLATPGVGSGVITVITSVLPDLLGQFGVPTALGGIVGDYVYAILTGTDPKVARQEAVKALEDSPAIDSAAKTTVADSLALVNTTLLSNPAIQQALGTTITTLITTLASNSTIQANVSPALSELLANNAVIGEVASAVGSAVTQLLGYPGFSAGLLGAVNQYADDLIDGAQVGDAQTDALQTFRSTPAVIGAVNAVVPSTVNSLLGYPNVIAAVGLYANEATIASLQRNRFNIRFLDETIGQIVNGSVESLLTRQAGVVLADDLAVNVVLGMPWSDWRGFSVQEIIAKPSLQVAVGMSLGQGIGSLFGDNIVAQMIGVAVGVPAVLAVGIGSLVAGFFQWIFGRPSYAVTPSPAAAQATHHVRTDLYVTNTVVLVPAAVGASVGQ